MRLGGWYLTLMGKNMMEYKGFLGFVEFDDEAGIFHGEVVNIPDVITFQGESVDDLRRAFRDSVEDYLDFCKERGEEPAAPSDPELIRAALEELSEFRKKLFVAISTTGKTGLVGLKRKMVVYGGGSRKLPQKKKRQTPKPNHFSERTL